MYLYISVKFQQNCDTNCVPHVDITVAVKSMFVLSANTVMILSFRTPRTFVVITLKFELCAFTID